MKQATHILFACIVFLLLATSAHADDQPLNSFCSIPDVKFSVGCNITCNTKPTKQTITVTFSWGKTNVNSYELVYWNLADPKKDPSHYDVKIITGTSLSVSNWPSGNPIGFKVAKLGSCSSADQYVYPTDPRGAIASCNASCCGTKKPSPTPAPPINQTGQCSSASHTLNYSYINNGVYYGTWPTTEAGAPLNEQTSMCQSIADCSETQSGSNLANWGPYNPSSSGNTYCKQKYSKTDEIYCCVENLPPPPNPCENVTTEGVYCGSGIIGSGVDANTLYTCKKDAQGNMQIVKSNSCGTLGCVKRPGQDDICAATNKTTCGDSNQGICVYSLDKSDSSLATLDAANSCKAFSLYSLFGYSCTDLSSYSCDSFIDEPYGSTAIPEGKNTCFNNGSSPHYHVCCQPNLKPTPQPKLSSITCGTTKQGYCTQTAGSCKDGTYALTDESTCGVHQSNTSSHLEIPNVCCLPTVKDTNASDQENAAEERFLHLRRRFGPTATPTPKLAPTKPTTGGGTHRVLVLGAETIASSVAQNIYQTFSQIISSLLHPY